MRGGRVRRWAQSVAREGLSERRGFVQGRRRREGVRSVREGEREGGCERGCGAACRRLRVGFRIGACELVARVVDVETPRSWAHVAGRDGQL
eukprot:6192372-Pleurochrysis_carterae.AAC.4